MRPVSAEFYPSNGDLIRQLDPRALEYIEERLEFVSWETNERWKPCTYLVFANYLGYFGRDFVNIPLKNISDYHKDFGA